MVKMLVRILIIAAGIFVLDSTWPLLKPVHADHFSNSSLVCVLQISTIHCRLRIGPLKGVLPANQGVTVSIAGHAELDPSSPPATFQSGSSPCSMSLVRVDTRTSFTLRVGPAGCIAGESVDVMETLYASAEGGGPLVQTIASPSLDSATVQATLADGTAFAVPGTFEGSTKVCTTNQDADRTVVSCSLTIGPLISVSAGETMTATLANPDGTPSDARAVFITGSVERGGGACATTDPSGVGGSSFFITTTGPCSGRDVVVITEQLAVNDAGGGRLCQRLAGTTLRPVTICATTPGNDPFVLPSGPVAQAAPVSAAKACLPVIPADLPNPVVQVRVGQRMTCTVTVTGAPPPAGSAQVSGTATVTLRDAVFLDGAGSARLPCAPAVQGAAATSTAPAVGATCTFTETFVPTTPCVTPTQVIELLGASFAPAVVTATGLSFQVLPSPGRETVCGPPIAGVVQPAGLGFTCGSSPGILTLLGDSVELPVPGRIGDTLLAAVGILPEVVSCAVRPVNTAGKEIGVAPGTILVSAAAGLLDASGKRTSSLRISCGQGAEVSAAPGLPMRVNPNTCTQVEFSLMGHGVSIVEVRARYEPLRTGTPTGVVPVEATANVGFVAPALNVTLRLDDNPISVGGQGTVTVELAGMDRLCAATRCLDPTTGLPVRLRSGSALSGSVRLTIDAPAVAAWVAAPGSGNQLLLRCGRAPSGANSSAAGYFRGCASVSATFRANRPGETDLTATFVPDLPGAIDIDATITGLPPRVAAMATMFARASRYVDWDTLEVEPGIP